MKGSHFVQICSHRTQAIAKWLVSRKRTNCKATTAYYIKRQEMKKKYINDNKNNNKYQEMDPIILEKSRFFFVFLKKGPLYSCCQAAGVLPDWRDQPTVLHVQLQLGHSSLCTLEFPLVQSLPLIPSGTAQPLWGQVGGTSVLWVWFNKELYLGMD